MKICNMEQMDVQKVSELEQCTFTMPWSEQSFLDAVLNKNMLFVVAKEADEILGYCGMQYVMDEGEITNVAVSSMFQNQGIGEKMLLYLMAEAKKLGILKLILEVRVTNKNAIHLYKKIGFKKIGVRKDLYEQPREDGYIMTYNQ